jgi:hypothetical protein
MLLSLIIIEEKENVPVPVKAMQSTNKEKPTTKQNN